jgi:glycosyltransferase involved in cell wall biosynthesis
MLSANLVIVEQASRLLLNYELLWHQRRGRTRVAFWGHGRSFAGDASPVAERVKARVSGRVHWWFAYTERTARILTQLGYPADRVTVVDNAIDTEQLAAQIEHARAAAIPAELRRELELGHGPVGLFLGTLREDKGLEVLFDAADRIHQERDDFRLLVVGSGPLEDEVERRAGDRSWLHHLGSRYGEDLAGVLALADLVLLPGAVGLVALDSFVAAAPLVTAVERDHGPELAYLRHRENALVVEGGTDPARYAEAVLEVLGDDELAARLVAGCEASATRYTIDAMVRAFAQGIRRALAAPALR